MTIAQDRGRHGEDIAAAFLASKGFEIRERNVRLQRYEIDIVAYDPGEKMMVFVEVKTRRKNSDAYPIRASVDVRKRRAMHAAISRWTIRHGYDGPGRTDVICVAGDRVIEHIVDVGSDFAS